MENVQDAVDSSENTRTNHLGNKENRKASQKVFQLLNKHHPPVGEWLAAWSNMCKFFLEVPIIVFNVRKRISSSHILCGLLKIWCTTVKMQYQLQVISNNFYVDIEMTVGLWVKLDRIKN